MTNSSKGKGDRAELEVQALWREHTGVPARRALGAGRKDDIGDITGIPDTVVQVCNWQNVAAAVRTKPLEAEEQRLRTSRPVADCVAGADSQTGALIFAPVFGHPAPFACTFVRLRGGDYRVVLTPEQFFAIWREAVN